MKRLSNLLISVALVSFSIAGHATAPSKYLAKNTKTQTQTIQGVKPEANALHKQTDKYLDANKTPTKHATNCEYMWCTSLVSNTHPLHALVPEAWILQTPMPVLNDRKYFKYEYATALQWKNAKLTYNYLPNYRPISGALGNNQTTVHEIWLQAFTERNFAHILKPYAGIGSIISSTRSNQLPGPVGITVPYAEIGVKTEHTVVNLYVGVRSYGHLLVHKNPFDVGTETIPTLQSKIVFRIEHPLVGIGLK